MCSVSVAQLGAVCRRCQQWKPAADFAAAARKKNGLQSWCRECHQMYAREWRQAMNVVVPTVEAATCLKCGHQKPASAFWCCRSNRNGLANWCKECANAYRREHQETINTRTRDWYARHILARRLYGRTRNHRRRALEAQAEGHYTAQDVVALYVAQNGLCAYDGTDLSQGYHVDHMIPLSRPGGTNWPTNLCLACASCNLAKGERTAEEFRAYLATQPAQGPRTPPWARWSRSHPDLDACLRCGRSDRTHKGWGYCGACYRALRLAGSLPSRLSS